MAGIKTVSSQGSGRPFLQSTALILRILEFCSGKPQKELWKNIAASPPGRSMVPGGEIEAGAGYGVFTPCKPFILSGSGYLALTVQMNSIKIKCQQKERQRCNHSKEWNQSDSHQQCPQTEKGE